MTTKQISNRPYNFSAYFRKFNQSSYLIKTLTKRELKIKYSKTFIGIGWVILQPLIVVSVYTIFFKSFIKLNTENIPYPLFVLSGLVLWYLFTGIISKCTYSLIESSDLINKVSFPRIIILLSKCLPVILECLLLLTLSILVVQLTQHNIGLNALTCLFYFAHVALLSFSIGMLCSIVALKFRDIAHAIPFVFNFGIWLTPVFYTQHVVPTAYKSLYLYGNPLTIPLEGMRGALFNNNGISYDALFLFLFTCILFTISSAIFIKFEKRIVENL